MDLLGTNNQTEEQVKAKKWMKIIGVILVLLFLTCIALVMLIYYIQSTEFKFTVDGQAKQIQEDLFIFEGEKVYIPIRAFAGYVGYSSQNGDYKQYAEDTTKCYVESENEIASFSLDSNKIYKKLLVGNNDYEYYEIDEPVKVINGNLYTTIEGAQIAFNISMGYEKEKNSITVYTLPYLVKSYSLQFANAGLTADSREFSNQKAVLYGMFVVRNTGNSCGVYSLNGQEILGTKYASIKFIESMQDFIVTTEENKMGIISSNAVTKINPEYDDVRQLDKELNLYLVQNNRKQGIVNSTGNVIIYPEYDQIGIDATRYGSNNIKNQYLLFGTCIPAKKDNKWGLFDRNGNAILPLEYDDLGCSAGSMGTVTTAVNNILIIPEYEGIIVKKENLYGLVNTKGQALLPTVLTSVYSISSAGEETYYMLYQNRNINIIEYLEAVEKSHNSSQTNNEATNTTTQNNVTDGNTANNVPNNITGENVDSNTQTNTMTGNTVNNVPNSITGENVDSNTQTNTMTGNTVNNTQNSTTAGSVGGNTINATQPNET